MWNSLLVLVAVSIVFNITPSKATKCKNPNEVFDNCPNPCPPQRCDVDISTIRCAAPPKPGDPQCKPGYRCADGYVRNAEEKCVKREECPKCTKPNEVYDACPPICPPQTCESLNGTYNCPNEAIPRKNCKGSCRCKPGYYRNKIGECISKEDCEKCSGPHEYFSCGGECDNVCANLREQNQTNCPLVNFVCNPMCYCEEGYARDENNICIPIEKCKVLECGKHESVSLCPAYACRPLECSEVGFPVACPSLAKDSKCPNKPACICDDGYVKNEAGVCIPIDKCPSCGGDFNATSGCGINCGRLCSNYKTKDVSCIDVCYINACDCKKGFVLDDNTGKCVRPKDCTPICGVNEVYDVCANGGCRRRKCSEGIICIDPIACKGGCVCRENYTRADNGTCIPENQCGLQCTKPNEIIDYCPQTCPPQTCESIGKIYPCPLQPAGCKPPACRCKQGFYRNVNGDCVSEAYCKKCPGPHEYFSCGGACDNVCATIHEQNQTSCPIVNIKCNDKCYCQEGYARDANGTCIPIDECPAPTCGVNEVYDVCANGGCRRRKCSEAKICIRPKACKGGCVCQENYTRADNGTCIPENQCGLQCTKPNEIIDYCPQTCSPQTCESIGKIYHCPLQPAVCKPPACRCKEGFYRNVNGDCVSEAYCKKCPGPHEYFSCGGACDNVCATIHEQNQTSCPIVNIKCNDKCYCQEGYARDANGTCIPIDECPAPTCGVNEVYDVCANGGCRRRKCSEAKICIRPKACKGGCVCQENYTRADNGTCIPENQCAPQCADGERYEECANNLCEPTTCSQLGFPLNCSALSDDSNTCCKPACICDFGNVRDRCGNCIPVEQCPSCGGDRNAVSGCGNNCGRRCSDYKKKGVVCPLFCKLNGCDCREGLVFDDNTQKCVLPEKCSPTCGKNEVYDSCSNGGCRRWDCARPKLCIDPLECRGGCVCQKGFTRDYNGNCIPENKCPAPCTKRHEYYDPCPAICPPQTCESIGKIVLCPRSPTKGSPECRGQCRCEKGFYRNSIGECITEKNCLKCSGPNEYYSCGSACDNVCDTLQKQNQTNCPINNKKCTPRCYCAEGYARNKNNTCIPIEQCEVSCHRGSNAVPGCSRHCSDVGEKKRTESSSSCDEESAPPSNVNVTEAIAKLDKGSIAFNADCLYQVSQISPDDNVVFSATSMLVPMAQIAVFSRNKAYNELMKLLNLDSKDEIKSAFLEETSSYANQKDVELELATKYYANENYPLSDVFIEVSKTYFNASGENIDFSNSQQAADTINEWVEDRTHDRITNLVSPDMLGPDTVVVLVNAIYFLGNWVHQFNPNNTEKRDFTKRNNDVVQLDTMYQENTFRYTENEDLNLQAIELPYKNPNISFMVILPKSGYYDATIKLLRDEPDTFTTIRDSMNYEKVKLYLPKMLISTTLDMADILKKIGLEAIFDPNSNGFKCILKNDKVLYISDAVQKAFFKCDETGTEAAAATAIGITTLSLPLNPPPEFRADRPYLFYIVFQKRVILFSGAFVG